MSWMDDVENIEFQNIMVMKNYKRGKLAQKERGRF